MASAVCHQVLIKQRRSCISFFCTFENCATVLMWFIHLKKITFFVITPFTYLINY